jgi:hypothetical protein
MGQPLKMQERADLRGQFLKGRDLEGRKAGAGKRQPKNQPLCQREQEKPPGVTQKAAVHQSLHDSRPSSVMDDPMNADEHSVERDCHQSQAPNHHRT